MLAFELLNTSIEASVDIKHPEISPIARVSKDAAAGAVLVAAAMAVGVGLVLFLPPVIRLFR